MKKCLLESRYICLKLEKSNNTDSTEGGPMRISEDEPFTASINTVTFFKNMQINS